MFSAVYLVYVMYCEVVSYFVLHFPSELSYPLCDMEVVRGRSDVRVWRVAHTPNLIAWRKFRAKKSGLCTLVWTTVSVCFNWGCLSIDLQILSCSWSFHLPLQQLCVCVCVRVCVCVCVCVSTICYCLFNSSLSAVCVGELLRIQALMFYRKLNKSMTSVLCPSWSPNIQWWLYYLNQWYC